MIRHGSDGKQARYKVDSREVSRQRAGDPLVPGDTVFVP